jgi:hypothetical protein
MEHDKSVTSAMTIAKCQGLILQEKSCSIVVLVVNLVGKVICWEKLEIKYFGLFALYAMRSPK